MRSMVEGASHTLRSCRGAPSVGFAATSPLKGGG